MCGIAGLVALSQRLDLGRTIRRMTDAVRHRGPDGEGVFQEGRVALGHRRLAIVDLSEAGHQPMETADGRYVITFNGEVYNHHELRRELAAQGARFRSGTDTEVLLTAFATWGPAALHRMTGMWAFAILDRAEGRIFAARDRFGEKPFHYVRTETAFAFGSEIRQLLPLLPKVQAERGAVGAFLLTGIPITGEGTFFEGVKSLPPGHAMTYEVATDTLEIAPWYDFAARVAALPETDGDSAVERLRELLEASIRRQLRADVTVGTCLSGGLDSSAVALLAARINGANGAKGSNGVSSTMRGFAAITAISEDPINSEEGYAARVVEKGHLTWLRTRPDYDRFKALLPEVVRRQEEPFASPSIVMQAAVMETAKANGVTVLLDGQGADETLLGYDRYYAPVGLAMLRRRGPKAAFGWLRKAAANNTGMSPARILAHGVRDLIAPLRYAHYGRRSPHLRPTPPLPDWLAGIASAGFDLRALQVQEVGVSGLPPLLRYEDRNSMAVSVETRLPFLDHQLAEHAVSLSAEEKMRGGWAKSALRRAMADLLPPDIAWRRNKIGFAAPDSLWLTRHGEEMERVILASPLVNTVCDPGSLRRHLPRLDRPARWRLYNLAMWEEAFGVAL